MVVGRGDFRERESVCVCAAEREDSVECVCRERGRGLLRECMWQKGRELGESVADYPSLSVLKTQNVIIDL